MATASPAHQEWIASAGPRVTESGFVNLVVVPMELGGEVVWKRLPKQLAAKCPEVPLGGCARGLVGQTDPQEPEYICL